MLSADTAVKVIESMSSQINCLTTSWVCICAVNYEIYRNTDIILKIDKYQDEPNNAL